MLDINFIRTNPELVKQKLEAKKFDSSKVDLILNLDLKNRNLMTSQQTLNASRNEKSQMISQFMKDGKSAEAEKIKKEVLADKNKLEEINAELEKNTIELNALIEIFPNLCHDTVAIGKDEKENVEVKKFSTPTKFDFEPLAHWDLGDNLELFLPEIATKITGSRFITYYNFGAKLYRALQQFTLDMNIKNNFIEVLPQVIVNADSLFCSGQLPKFEEDLFKIANSNYYLSPTAEVQLVNIFRNTIVSKDDLPKKVTANTPCFRSEAGSAGRDTRGVIRLHQFHKTELVCLCEPTQSYSLLEGMTRQAESILEALELPYRRIMLCTGDTGFASSMTYDIEVWLPSYSDYKEISSCSNCEDFQARRGKIRFKDEDGKNKFVHTLNGSSLAIDRLWVAVVENYQQKDGSIKIPKVLIPYMSGLSTISK
ncbi:MAG: serine--tRNA ligase [Mycoplasma sp.]